MIIATKEDLPVRNENFIQSSEKNVSEKAGPSETRSRNPAVVPDTVADDVRSGQDVHSYQGTRLERLSSTVNRARWKTNHQGRNEEMASAGGLDSDDGTIQAAAPQSMEDFEYQSKLVSSLRSIEPHILDFRTVANLNIFHLELESGRMQKAVSDIEDPLITPSILDLRKLEDILHRYYKSIF